MYFLTGHDSTCDCEPAPILAWTVRTAFEVDKRVTEYDYFIRYDVTITNEDQFPPPAGLHTFYMRFTVVITGVYYFHVTAVSICSLAHNVQIRLIVSGGLEVVVVQTGRYINDAENPFPVGVTHVALCLNAGDVVEVHTGPKIDPNPGYYYPDAHATDVWFGGCLIAEMTSCPATGV